VDRGPARLRRVDRHAARRAGAGLTPPCPSRPVRAAP
jgi:hypothetical protein